MTYNPESDSPTSTVDIASTITSSIACKNSNIGKIKHNLKSSSGTTSNELDVLEPAPLVFPALDLQKRENEEASKKGKKIENGKKFVDEYYDRRAQAKFVSLVPPLAMIILASKLANIADASTSLLFTSLDLYIYLRVCLITSISSLPTFILLHTLLSRKPSPLTLM